MKDNQNVKEYNVKEVMAKDKKRKVLNNVGLVNGYNEQTIPIQTAAWSKNANILNNCTVKGSRVMLEGSWQVNQHEANGQTVYNNYLLVQSVTFLETKDVFENKKTKLESQKDPFGNIAAGKETIHNMPDDIQWNEDDMPF